MSPEATPPAPPGELFCSKPWPMTSVERALLDLAKAQHQEFARLLKDGGAMKPEQDMHGTRGAQGI